MEGFDAFTDLGGMNDNRWDSGSDGHPVGGRFGGQCWAINGYIQKTFPIPGSFIVGFAFAAAQPDQNFFNIVTVDFSHNVVPALSFYFGGTSTKGLTTVIAGSTVLTNYLYPLNLWQYMEFKCLPGTIEMRVDGRVIGSFGGPDQVIGFNWVSSFYTGNNAIVDDIYICDTAPTVPPISQDPFIDYLGDIKVRGFGASSVGSVNQWAPATGANTPANKVAQVAALPTDHGEQNRFDASLTIDAIDLYKISPATRGVPKAIQFNVTHAKDSSDLRTVATVGRFNNANFVGAPTSDYTYYRTMTVLLPVNPGTNTVWTLGTIAAAEFGIKIAA